MWLPPQYLYYYHSGAGQATVSLRKTQTPLVPSSWQLVASNLPWHRNGCPVKLPNGNWSVIYGETSALPGIGIATTSDFATYTTLNATWSRGGHPTQKLGPQHTQPPS